MTGICGSDVHFFKTGRPANNPLTIGHEGLGVIVLTGSNIDPSRIGERVVIEPNIPCCSCHECISGRGNICRNKRIIGVTENGCFAEFVRVPADFAHSLPESITDRDAVAIEPAAVALAALFRSKARPGDSILVIGLGAIGLLVTHIGISLGYRVFVIEPVESKLEKALDMGAFEANPDSEEPVSTEVLELLCQRERISSVFECAGAENTATLAIAACPRGGEVILLGLSTKPAVFNPMDLTKKGIHLVPSIIYDHPVDFMRIISLTRAGIIQPGCIVSRTFRLTALQEALETAVSGSESKIVVQIV
jgi:threonine dehydrogenase-like Zn-dependent dehydrogenase